MTPSPRHRHVLGLVLGAALLLAAVTLFEVLGTVFFAITVAYLLVPAQGWLTDRGTPPRLASVCVSTVALIVAMLPVSGIAYVLYQRRTQLVAVIEAVPEQFVLEFGAYAYVVDISVLVSTASDQLSGLAVGVATAIPVLALKFALFAFLVYALVLRSDDAAAAIVAPVPAAYHDVLRAFHERVRETLYAIYVLQVATAAGTFALALPVFLAFGYELAITMAFVAAALQFLPVVGPSVLVGALGAFEASAGAPVRAVLIAVVGLIVVAGLPDLLVRPRLASSTAGISGSLYFVGFVGGLLTLGPVGIVAGPLVVALVVEAMAQLAADAEGRGAGEPGGGAADTSGDSPADSPLDSPADSPADPPADPPSDALDLPPSPSSSSDTPAQTPPDSRSSLEPDSATDRPDG